MTKDEGDEIVMVLIYRERESSLIVVSFIITRASSNFQQEMDLIEYGTCVYRVASSNKENYLMVRKTCYLIFV